MKEGGEKSDLNEAVERKNRGKWNREKEGPNRDSNMVKKLK